MTSLKSSAFPTSPLHTVLLNVSEVYGLNLVRNCPTFVGFLPVTDEDDRMMVANSA